MAVQNTLQPQPDMPRHSFVPLQPVYSNLNYEQSYQPVSTYGRSQQDMEAAFERALEDARAQTKTETTLAPQQEEEIAEIIREPKGDFEAVWESLRPEAERLNKLAEWEKDFSQVSAFGFPNHHSSVIMLGRTPWANTV